MYEELVKELREPCPHENCVICQKAADAIEELSKRVEFEHQSGFADGQIAASRKKHRCPLIPAADVVERKVGRWIPVTNGRGGFECNLCHNYAPSYRNGAEDLSAYCPNCGAKMEGTA